MNRGTVRQLAVGVWTALAFVPGLPLSWLFLEGIRQAVCASMLESGMPELEPGDAPIVIQHIDWPNSQVSWNGWPKQYRIGVNSWNVAFPSAPQLRHDSSCGASCDRATLIDRLECRSPGSTHAVACRMHFWTSSDGASELCFLEINEEGGGTPAAEDESDPTRAVTDCPKSFGWRSR